MSQVRTRSQVQKGVVSADPMSKVLDMESTKQNTSIAPEAENNASATPITDTIMEKKEDRVNAALKTKREKRKLRRRNNGLPRPRSTKESIEARTQEMLKANVVFFRELKPTKDGEKGAQIKVRFDHPELKLHTTENTKRKFAQAPHPDPTCKKRMSVIVSRPVADALAAIIQQREGTVTA